MKQYAVSPIDTPEGIVKGKRYLVTQWYPSSSNSNLFILSVNGNDILCLAKSTAGCAHIEHKQWTIIEEEDETHD